MNTDTLSAMLMLVFFFQKVLMKGFQARSRTQYISSNDSPRISWLNRGRIAWQWSWDSGTGTSLNVTTRVLMTFPHIETFIHLSKMLKNRKWWVLGMVKCGSRLQGCTKDTSLSNHYAEAEASGLIVCFSLLMFGSQHKKNVCMGELIQHGRFTPNIMQKQVINWRRHL